MDVNDVLRLIEHLAWPMVAVATLVLLRRPLGGALTTIAQRAGKLDLRVVTIELSPEISPDWRVNMADERLDLRHLTSDRVFDSYSITLFSQLGQGTHTDVAVMDLGDGHEWLTSRLYLFATLLERLRGVRCLIFLRSTPERTQQVFGASSPELVRDALAMDEPWLEASYLAAWSARCGAANKVPGAPIDSASWDDITIPHIPLDASSAMFIAQVFIRLIQTSKKPVPSEGWEEFLARNPGDRARKVWEHTRWIDPAALPTRLGRAIDARSNVQTDPTDAPSDQKRSVLLQEGTFATLVEKDGTLRGVVDRAAMLDAAVRGVLHSS